MMNGFERYLGIAKRGGRCPLPLATITRSGLIRINAQTFRKYDFSGCTHFVLYYNAASQQIGIEFNDDEDAEGCRGVKVDTVRGVQISTKSYLKHYGIDLSESKRYEVSYNEASNMLIIDLMREVL